MVLIKSIIIYLATFSLSLFLFWLFEKKQKTYKRVRLISERGVCLLLAILVPCILAALRDDTVGVDVTVYANTALLRASNYSTIPDLIKGMDLGTEYIYAALLFIISRITTNTAVLLFCFQLLTIVPVFVAAYNMRGYLSITNVMFAYLFLYYNESLNIMRQSVSCAFLILAFVYWIKKNKKGFIFSLLFALLFHKSSFIGFLLAMIIMGIIKSKFRMLIKIPLYVFVVMSPALISSLSFYFQNLGLFDSRYNFYIDVFINQSVKRDYFTDPMSIYNLIFVFVKLAIVYISVIYPNIRKNGESAEIKPIVSVLKQYILIGFLGFVTVLYTLKTTYGIRITMFLDFYVILLIPLIMGNKVHHTDKNYVLKKYNAYSYAVILMYWFLWIMKMGWSGSSAFLFRF